MDDLQEYIHASDLMEKESDRYWNRSNIMLLIQGALIALYGGIYEKSALLSIAVATQGCIFSIFWYGIVHKGSLYVRRWDSVIYDMEIQLRGRVGEEFFALRHMNDAARVNETDKYLSKFSTTKLMKWTIVSVLVFWAVVVSYSVYNYAVSSETPPIVTERNNGKKN